MLSEVDIKKPPDSRDSFRGVSGVAVTPMVEDGTLDLDSLSTLLTRLDGAGLGTIVLGGNTGEFAALSDDEVAEIYRIGSAAVRKTRLICSIGGAISRALRAAKVAELANADFIMVHEPSDPFASSDGLVSYYAAIAESAELPLIVYARSSRLSNSLLTRVLDIGGYIAVKDARNNLPAFREAVQVSPDVVWICGSAETWAPFYSAAGARTFTSGLVNVAPALTTALLRAMDDGDQGEVWRLWSEIKPFEDLRNADGGARNVSIVKDAMAQCGLGTPFVRPPLARVGAHDQGAIGELLARWRRKGLLDEEKQPAERLVR